MTRWQRQFGVVGNALPVSREATVRLRLVTQKMVNTGTPMECCITFFDGIAGRFHYRLPWWRRVLYTSWAGSHLFKAPDGKLQS